jgi:hypothetical protein
LNIILLHLPLAWRDQSEKARANKTKAATASKVAELMPKKRARKGSSDKGAAPKKGHWSNATDRPLDKRLKLEQPLGIDLRSTDTRPIKATKLALDIIRANEITIETSRTGKVIAVVTILKVFGDKFTNSRNANQDRVGTSFSSKKGPQTYIPTTKKRVVPQSWGTSNGTFQTKRVGVIDISFMEYSASKSVKLTPDIVEHKVGAQAPLYDLIIGKQTLHDIGAVLVAGGGGGGGRIRLDSNRGRTRGRCRGGRWRRWWRQRAPQTVRTRRGRIRLDDDCGRTRELSRPRARRRSRPNEGVVESARSTAIVAERGSCQDRALDGDRGQTRELSRPRA